MFKVSNFFVKSGLFENGVFIEKAVHDLIYSTKSFA